MGKIYPEIDERLAEFIRHQRVFFVGTAPLDPGGHVNVSPKGHDSFVILDGRTVAYLDLIGSGIETVAHLKENGRIVILFCSFEGPPFILRLYGKGEVFAPEDAEYEALRAQFPSLTGERTIIRVAVERIQDACGMGVPHFSFAGQRPHLAQYYDRAAPGDLERYMDRENRTSIDGLPGIE